MKNKQFWIYCHLWEAATLRWIHEMLLSHCDSVKIQCGNDSSGYQLLLDIRGRLISGFFRPDTDYWKSRRLKTHIWVFAVKMKICVSNSQQTVKEKTVQCTQVLILSSICYYFTSDYSDLKCDVSPIRCCCRRDIT